MTKFWRNWLTIWCWGVVGFGVLLAGAGFPATQAPTQLLLTILYDGGAVELDQLARFAVGLMGALTMAMGLLMGIGIGAADTLGTAGAPVWRRLVMAAAAWYVVDSAISCANGFTLNAVSNTLIMIAFLIPVLASGVLRGVDRVPAGMTDAA